MKKILIIAGLVLAATMTYAGSAFANNGPHKGTFDNFTDACAGCHRAHTATQSYLLKSGNTIYEFCMTCHNGSVANVYTNVQDGLVTSIPGSRLNGGGFANVGGAGAGHAVTSIHRVDGAPDPANPGLHIGDPGAQSKTQTAFGSSVAGVSGTLECTSCHNPHGSANYRILKDDHGLSHGSSTKWVNNADILDYVDADMPVDPSGSLKAVLAGKNYSVLATDADVAAGVAKYAIGDPMATFSDLSGNPTGYYPIKQGYTEGMVRFCATCHKQYWVKSNSWKEPSSTSANNVYPSMQDTGSGAIDRYRHTTSRYFNSTYTTGGGDYVYGRITSNPLRMAIGTWTDPAATAEGVGGVGFGSTCLMCHFAHGTSAQQSGVAGSNGGNPGYGPSGDSALLYHPNRGTCRSCHMTSN